MKTFVKVIGAIVVTLVLAVGVFYVGWLVPPAADKVCDNVVAVTSAARPEIAAAATGALAIEHLRKQCMAQATTPPRYGKVPWVTQLKCMRDAGDAEALKACSAR